MSISLTSSSSYAGSRDHTLWWLWTASIDVSPPDTLESIQYVEYHLPSSFENPIRMTRERSSCFSIREQSWGTFALKAFAVFKDESKEPLPLTHRLSFEITKEGVSGKNFYVFAKHSGKYLGINNVSKDNGATAVQWGLNPAHIDLPGYYDNHKFQLIDAGDGYWFLRAKHSGKYLGINNVSKDNGATAVQWGLNPAHIDLPGYYDNHKFKLEPVDL